MAQCVCLCVCVCVCVYVHVCLPHLLSPLTHRRSCGWFPHLGCCGGAAGTVRAHVSLWGPVFVPWTCMKLWDCTIMWYFHFQCFQEPPQFSMVPVPVNIPTNSAQRVLFLVFDTYHERESDPFLYTQPESHLYPLFC